MRSGSGGRSFIVLGLLPTLLVLAWGCPTPSEYRVPFVIAGPGALQDLLVPARPITLLPDRYWEATDDPAGWSFRNEASLLCYLRDGGEAPLEWRLRVDPQCAHFHFEVSWDGEPLMDGPTAAEDGTLELVIPAARAGPGLHQLRLKRAYPIDDAGLRGDHDNRFRSVTVQRGGRRVSLGRGRDERTEVLDDFLSLGVAGAGEWKMPGCLVEGDRRVVGRIAIEEPGVLELMAENISTGAASFVLRVGGGEARAEVGPGASERLEVEVGAGLHDLSLAVEGRGDGLYLWGAPYLDRKVHPELPPVILITLDTTRRDALGACGAPAGTTPALDRLADVATVYDNAWSTSPWTLPSHASLFTGLYPSHHGAGVSDDRLRREQLTLAEILEEQGYFTAGVAGGHLASSHFGLGQGFLRYRDPEGFETRGDRVTDAALQVLSSSGHRPLFLFVNYFDPHGLYRAPAPFPERFDVPRLAGEISTLPYWQQMLRGEVAGWAGIIKGEAPVTEATLEYLRAAYTAEVAYMDEQLGRLVAGIERAGLFDDGVLVVVADHGELLGEGGFFSHGCRLDPELTAIPLLVKLPGQLRGERRQELVSQVDIWPTLLDLLHLTAPVTDGLSLLPGNTEAGVDDRKSVFMEEHQSRVHLLFENMSIANHLYGIQHLDGRELVWQGGHLCQRRQRDGWIAENCGGSWQERLVQLGALADVRLGDRGSAVPTGASGLNPEDEEALRALGYLE
jgi:arylsulfatase A-like enzyme